MDWLWHAERWRRVELVVAVLLELLDGCAAGVVGVAAAADCSTEG